MEAKVFNMADYRRLDNLEAPKVPDETYSMLKLLEESVRRARNSNER